jgi:hypothetical protein
MVMIEKQGILTKTRIVKSTRVDALERAMDNEKYRLFCAWMDLNAAFKDYLDAIDGRMKGPAVMQAPPSRCNLYPLTFRHKVSSVV